MFNLPTPKDLLTFQIEYYTKRLADATRFEERKFLKTQLTNLKKQNDEPHSNCAIVYYNGLVFMVNPSVLFPND